MLSSTPDWLYDLLTVAILIGSIRLAWVDLKKLEIELETLAVVLILGLAQSVIYVDPFETGIRVFAGLAFWGILAFGNNRVPGLSRFGAGDPPLIGVIAFLVAPAILQWAILASLSMLATCAWYSHIRGKALFKSMYPAAPPLLIAGVAVYFWQWSM